MVLNVEKIMEYLPHRYPMLLVDRIIELVPMERCVGIKNVTMNEGFFQGHFPGVPIMPGVLIIEAMGQAGACMVLGAEEHKGLVPLIVAVDNVKLRKSVVPGDQLESRCEMKRFGGTVGRIRAEGFVNGEMVAEMDLTFKLVRLSQSP